MIKEITHNGKLFAMVIYQDVIEDKVKFFSNNESNLQIGLINKKKNDLIKPHKHLTNKRIIYTITIIT